MINKVLKFTFILISVFLINKTALSNDLTVATPHDPSVDPHWLYLGPNAAYSRYLFERLIDRDENANIVPRLAKSWKNIDDLTWEFNLRKGVKFHDGSDFTAADVMFSIDRIPNIPNNPASYESNVSMIDSVEATDSHTIIVKTKNPYPLLLRRLSGVAIVSKQNVEGSSTEDFASGKVAVGTGPYMFKSYTPGDNYQISINNNYWGDKPDFHDVTFKIMPDGASRVAALLSGDVDVLEGLSPSSVPAIESKDGFKVAKRASARTLWLYVDTQNDNSPFVTDNNGNAMTTNPLKDVKVRKAISLAINRDAIVSKVMAGLAEEANQVVPKGFFSYSDNIPENEFNVDKAKALMAEAGYADGFGLTVHAPNDRYVNDEKVAQAIAQMLSKIGLKMEVETMPKAVYFGKLNKQEFSLSMIGWDNAFTGSSLMSLSAAFHSKEEGYGSWNAGGYSNSKFDDAVESASASFDMDEYENYLKNAMDILIAEDQGAIPLHSQYVVVGTTDKVDYTPRADEAFEVMLAKKAN